MYLHSSSHSIIIYSHSQFLYHTVDNIVRVSAGLLCELAQEADSAAEIERENASARLTDLLHSHNEGIGMSSFDVINDYEL